MNELDIYTLVFIIKWILHPIVIVLGFYALMKWLTIREGGRDK